MPAAGQQFECMAKLVGEDEPLTVRHHGCPGYRPSMRPESDSLTRARAPPKIVTRYVGKP